MRAAGRSPGGPGEWNKVQKGQKSTWASCCLSTSPQKPPVPNLCHRQYNACHIGSYFIHSTPCRIVLHPSILSSCLSHVKQHVFLWPITCLPEIEHPVRIHCTLPASAHVKSPSVLEYRNSRFKWQGSPPGRLFDSPSPPAFFGSRQNRSFLPREIIFLCANWELGGAALSECACVYIRPSPSREFWLSSWGSLEEEDVD
jgi:hypothetical protein